MTVKTPTYQNQEMDSDETGPTSDYPPTKGRNNRDPARGPGHGMTNQGRAPRASQRKDGTGFLADDDSQSAASDGPNGGVAHGKSFINRHAPAQTMLAKIKKKMGLR